MPTRYKAKRRRRWRRGKPLRFRRKGLARQIRQIKKQLNSQADRRWLDHTNTSVAIPMSGLVMDACALSTISAGSLEGERTGDKISLNTLKIRGQLFVAATSTEGYNVVRLFIISVKKYRGTMPTIADFLQGDAIPPIGMPSHLSPFRKQSDWKYKVHWQKTMMVQHQAAGSTYPLTRLFNVNLNFGKTGLPITYENNDALPPITNNLFLVGISDSASSPHPIIAFTSRVTYLG